LINSGDNPKGLFGNQFAIGTDGFFVLLIDWRKTGFEIKVQLVVQAQQFTVLTDVINRSGLQGIRQLSAVFVGQDRQRRGHTGCEHKNWGTKSHFYSAQQFRWMLALENSNPSLPQRCLDSKGKDELGSGSLTSQTFFYTWIAHF
jgi:hypothetical protein